MTSRVTVSPMNGAGGQSCMWNSEPAINRGSKRWKPRERGSGGEVATSEVQFQRSCRRDLNGGRGRRGVSVLRTSEAVRQLRYPRPDGRGYFLTALRASRTALMGL